MERANGEAILAFAGDRCIAMIDSWCHRYIVDSEEIHVREMCEWYSLPEYRGVGLQPMWMMMKKPEPILSIGGTGATRSLLPRLGWKPLTQQIGSFVLRLSSGVLVENRLRRSRLFNRPSLIRLANRLSVPIGRIKRQAAPFEGTQVQQLEITDVPVEIIPQPTDYALVPLVDRKRLQWLYSAPPELGEFVSLAFSVNGTPVGLSTSRLFTTGYHCAANILQLQATEVSTGLYAWMVSETAARLAGHGAGIIRCRASCPKLADAMHMTGFSRHDVVPASWWSRDREVPSGSILLSLLHSDDGIRPYPD